VNGNVIQLFTPPFDKSKQNPGYIKGYLPGVRENGGQYTHAAMWFVLAHCEVGELDTAYELFSLINPINADVQKYMAEPYVFAADVYSHQSHAGRGGWTWYTGSASWAYLCVLEGLLGIKLVDNHLTFRHTLPKKLGSPIVKHIYKSTEYELLFEKTDSTTFPKQKIKLVDDGGKHILKILYNNDIL
jgi:cellobiose phosphorylase